MQRLDGEMRRTDVLGRLLHYLVPTTASTVALRLLHPLTLPLLPHATTTNFTTTTTTTTTTTNYYYPPPLLQLLQLLLLLLTIGRRRSPFHGRCPHRRVQGRSKHAGCYRAVQDEAQVPLRPGLM